MTLLDFSNGCSTTTSITITPDKTVCSNSSPIDLGSFGPSPSTGTWAGPSGSISNGFINVSALPLGQNSFTFTRTSDHTNFSMILTVVQTIGGNSAVTYNSSSCNTVSGTLLVSNYSGNIQQWERSYDNGATWYAIPSSNSPLISFNESQAALFRADVANNGCPLVYSTTSSVQPITPVGGELSPSILQILCGSANGNLSLSNYTGDNLTWQSSLDGNSWSNLTATGNQYAFNVSAQTYFRVQVSQSTTTCAPQNSTTYVVNVASFGGQTSSNVTAQCNSASGQINLTNFVGNILQWESSTDGNTWVPVVGKRWQQPVDLYNRIAY